MKIHRGHAASPRSTSGHLVILVGWITVVYSFSRFPLFFEVGGQGQVTGNPILSFSPIMKNLRIKLEAHLSGLSNGSLKRKGSYACVPDLKRKKKAKVCTKPLPDL